MRPHFWFIALFILVSCKPKPVSVATNAMVKPVRVLQASYKTTTTIKAPKVDTAGTDGLLDAYTNYYVLVADTGKSYDDLHSKMFNLHQSSSLAIDTMGRFYNKAKDLIQLPDNDEDEIYAGDYYPRRFPSQNLSLEYFEVYNQHSDPKMIALIAGIYETKASADSALNAIRPDEKAFVLKAKIYVGCMH